MVWWGGAVCWRHRLGHGALLAAEILNLIHLSFSLLTESCAMRCLQLGRQGGKKTDAQVRRGQQLQQQQLQRLAKPTAEMIQLGDEGAGRVGRGQAADYVCGGSGN